ncbi:MAG: type I DNA topoisomerase [Actinobacteria bacterium]|nr:type I DNA topoisomerase [Actinomycetota bacterium]
MSKPLVIVESPAKAKTIAGFLGSDFVVESSIGHIRDLPRNAADVPGALKGEPWARLGVDVENGFKPLYVVAREKRDQVNKLKALVRDASEVYLATDEDREGESIAWHLLEVLSPQVPVKRMVFHEITRGAIERAVADWRELDRRLVDAQEARRILDRLYGYEVSPVLWKKVMPRLSAGRVQSVATRMLVERERARMRFRSAEWWGLDATFGKDGATFGAVLAAVDGRRLADGKSFTEDGHLRPEAAGVVVLDEAGASGLAARLSQSDFVVRSVEEKPYTDRPKPPFMTSTLQQAAGSKLRFTAQRTMQTAQRLYENGHITYMRTDSTTLSHTALAAAREQATKLYGPDSVPSSPRTYQRKVKNAQEAHEAIRPAGDTFRHPREVARQVGPDEARLYDLIWRRTVASQMKDATGLTVTVRLGGTSSTGEDAEFSSGGTVITFTGFRRAYEEGADHVEAPATGAGADGDQERRLPALAEGDDVDALGFEAEAHATKPPARFTEASLVKALEEMGVGRPSTYASILGTIQSRGYVWKKGTALVPSFVAFAVVGLLERHFSELVDYGFTASMEDDLDAIATGNEEAVPWLTRFYFGNGTPGLRPMVSDHLGEIDAREINSIPLGTDEQDRLTVVRVGRYGPYVQRGDDRASVPEDMAPDELTLARAAELLEAPSDDRALGTDPASGLTVLVRTGRYGPYVQLGEEEAGGGAAAAGGKGRGNGSKQAAKPARVSLLKSMTPANVTLEDALRLLTLPRSLGTDPSTGEEIMALLGRYGPYVKKGSDSRSLGSEEQLFDITLEEALVIFAEPKRWQGRGGSAAPGRELGEDPATSRPMVIKNGRFGAYVTDGEVNASLPKSETAETISAERAADLLAEKRAKSAADPTAKTKAPRPKAKKTTKAKKATKARKAAAPAKKAAKPVKKAAKQTGKSKAAAAAKTARAGAAKKIPAADTAGSSPASEPSKAARFAKAVRAAKAAKR